MPDIFGRSDEEVEERKRQAEERKLQRQRMDEARPRIRDLTIERNALEAEIRQYPAVVEAELRASMIASLDKWSYLTLDDTDDEYMNQLGSIGWELVGIASYTVGFGIGGNSSMKVHMKYAFKRKMPALIEDTPTVEALKREQQANEARKMELDEELAELNRIIREIP